MIILSHIKKNDRDEKVSLSEKIYHNLDTGSYKKSKTAKKRKAKVC